MDNIKYVVQISWDKGKTWNDRYPSYPVTTQKAADVFLQNQRSSYGDAMYFRAVKRAEVEIIKPVTGTFKDKK